jgi:hypothetical protein
VNVARIAQSVQQGREFLSVEAEANAQVNLGHDYLVLGEPARALEHLQEAHRLYDQDVWYRWKYNLRLQAELARYLITQGDLTAATAHATTSAAKCGGDAVPQIHSTAGGSGRCSIPTPTARGSHGPSF